MAKELKSLKITIKKDHNNQLVVSIDGSKRLSDDPSLKSVFGKKMSLSGANQTKAQELFDIIEAQVKSEEGLE